MNLFPKMMALSLILFIVQTTHTVAVGYDNRSDGITEAFKSGDYTKAITLFEKTGASDPDLILLTAISYSRVGRNDARRLFKKIYRKKGGLGLFAGYMLADDYTLMGEYREAVHVYKNIISRTRRNQDFDTVVLQNAVFTKLYELQNVYTPARKLLYSASRSSWYARCLKALTLQQQGKTNEAADIFRAVLLDAENPCRIFVLKHIAGDRRTVTALLDKTFDPAGLIKQYQDLGMHDDAITVSNFVPDDDTVLTLRAESLIRKKMYDPALSLLQQIYEKTGSASLLLRLSSAYFASDDVRAARTYLDLYEHTVGTENLPAEASYLALSVHRMSAEQYIQAVSKFIDAYGEYPYIDALVYSTFYRVLRTSGEDRALEFLKKHVGVLKRPNYRGWAHYLLGLYDSPGSFNDTVLEYPGSYYFFKASSHIASKDDDSKNGNGDDQSTGLQKNGFGDDDTGDLQTLILMYSRGVQMERTRNRIQTILATADDDSWKYSIEFLNSGVFFRIFTLGIYDELVEILEDTYPVADTKVRYKLNYLFSRVYYARGDIYRGIAYAQRMAESFNRDYLIFLDDDIRMLLYPVAYEDTIAKVLKSDEPITGNLLLALIREESRFKPEALSAKGAVGLMQLMPDTAGWIMHRSVTTRDLVEPDFNIQVGTEYLRYLFKRFDSLEEVLAAYNGGPSNVTRWSQTDADMDTMVERIPYSETRDFVKKVYTSYMMYKTIYGDSGRIYSQTDTSR